MKIKADLTQYLNENLEGAGMKNNSKHIMKVGDIVALVNYGDGTRAVKITGETEKYFNVSLRNLKKTHPSRIDVDIDRDPEVKILNEKLFLKRTGVVRGENYRGSMRYCPDYITPLDPRLAYFKKDYEDAKQNPNLKEYCKELADEIEGLEKIKMEGILV